MFSTLTNARAIKFQVSAKVSSQNLVSIINISPAAVNRTTAASSNKSRSRASTASSLALVNFIASGIVKFRFLSLRGTRSSRRRYYCTSGNGFARASVQDGYNFNNSARLLSQQPTTTASSRVESRRRAPATLFSRRRNSAKARTNSLSAKHNTGDGTPDIISGFDAAAAR